LNIDLEALPPNPRDLSLSSQNSEAGGGTVAIPLFRQLGGTRVASLRSSILPQLQPLLTLGHQKSRETNKPSLRKNCQGCVRIKLSRMSEIAHVAKPRVGRVLCGLPWVVDEAGSNPERVAYRA
jgi:hypothetical protein